MPSCLAYGLGALLLVAMAHTADAADAALRGLKAPGGVIDFAPIDAYRAGTPAWQPGETPASATPQPSPLYGLRERAPGSVATTRYSYSYSDAIKGIFEAGPASNDPYTSTYALSGQIVRSFRGGFGLGLGLRQTQAGNNVLAVAVRQGWGPFTGGYTLYSGRNDAAPSPSHRFALDFNYGNRSSIGLSYTAGRDLQLGSGAPFTPGVDSRDLALSGRHWLAPQWALTYDVVNSDQAAYRRQGLRFGIRHTF